MKLAALSLAVALAAPAWADCTATLPAQDLQGRALPAELLQRGPLLVVFWSSDCAFCHRHNERIEQIYRAATDKPRVLGVAVDASPEAALAALRRRGYSFPVVMDRQGECTLRERFTSRRLVPMSCAVTTAGTAPRCIPGEMAEADLQELLQPKR